MARLIVDVAADILEIPAISLYRLDDERRHLAPIVSSEEFTERYGGAPSIGVGDTESAIWNAFATGSRRIVDEPVLSYPPSSVGEESSALILPVGDYGVFVVIGEGLVVDDRTSKLAGTLVATAESAFDRLDRDSRLRERDVELADRNRRLERQVQINEFIRTVNQSLVSANSRAEIERMVCSRLVESEEIEFAWIGDVAVGETELVARSWAGSDGGYLDAVSLELTDRIREPSVRTASTGESTVVTDVIDGLHTESWRKIAISNGFQSCLSIPLTFEEYSHGVLSLYAADPGTFDELERAVFEELGETIANSVTAVSARRALHAETVVELTLRFENSETLFVRIAKETGSHVEYKGMTGTSGETVRLFFTVDTGEASVVDDVLDRFVSVRDYRLVTEFGDSSLFEVTVTRGNFVSRLVRHGVNPRSITATDTELEAVVRTSTVTDVRKLIAMLEERHSGVELVSRRDVDSPVHTKAELVSSLLESLTDRQLEVVKTAYLAGFFEWPRESTGEEIAETLGVAQPTVNRHIRVSEKRIFSQLFESAERTST